MPAAGLMSERITLQSKSVTRNSIGEEVVSWGTLAVVWARVEPLAGREFIAAGQMQATFDTRVTIRYLAGVTEELRMLWRGVPYSILSVSPSERRSYMELRCVTGVHDGR